MKSRDWEIILFDDGREYYKWQFREIMAKAKPWLSDEEFDRQWHKAQLGQLRLLQSLKDAGQVH
jgi:hypothetical protein